jgi:hypothetical protein
LVEHVGELTVYDLTYAPSNADYAGALSVLVESVAGIFHEIYFRENTVVGAESRPTQVVRADGQTLIVEHYDDGGQYHGYEERFFLFIDREAKSMNPERIREAAKKEEPKDSAIEPLTPRFNFGDLTWTGYVGSENPWSKPNAGTPGRIVVHFKIEDGDFAPKSAEFIADPRSH